MNDEKKVKMRILLAAGLLIQQHRIMAELEGMTLREWYNQYRDEFRQYDIDVDKIDVNITEQEELVLVGLAHKGTPYPWTIQKPKHDSIDATTLVDANQGVRRIIEGET